MNVLIIGWVTTFFVGYIFFDAMAVLARAAAASASLNAFGAAIEKIMSTLKRISIFTFPPALGYFVYIQNEAALFISITFSYFFGGLILCLILYFRQVFLSYFFSVAVAFGSGLGIFRSFYIGASRGDNDRAKFLSEPVGAGVLNLLRENKGLFFLASWVYFVFGASIFLINIIALNFVEYAPIVLQALGLLNGLGTLVLAFFVDPKISRFLDSKCQLSEMILVIILAQLAGVWVYSGLFFLLVYYLF